RAAQVDALRVATAGWKRASFGGAPKVAQEVDAALLEGAVPAAVIVVLVTLVVLTLAFGAIVVSIKAVIMNVLSLSASFGALVWIFQDGRFESLLDYQSTGSIDPLVMLVMFAIVFGLSMDYELFLLSRIREDYGETGDARGSVARGLAATGRLITMAGLMLIIVLLGFGSAKILFVKQLGIGMAVAVAIDATIVRGLLVPATMRLLGRRNWWAPAWFMRWWTRWDIGVRELPPGTAPTPGVAAPSSSG
ncbi:MAG: MMPL family transporter, partial [Deltaproteobacteria bacterium]|nr:MMPL family transporter [Nannocystaceae bacterium]